MRVLLDSGADINLRSKHGGSTPLHTATAAKKVGAVSFLLRHGAEVNRQDAKRNTALHVAANNGSAPIATLLCEANADMSSRNLDGNTPLEAAIRRGHPNMVKYLLEKLSASRLNPVFDYSLLETAVKSEHREIVRLVLDFFPSSDVVNSMHETGVWRKSQAIFAAAYAGKQEILQLLVTNGFNVDDRNELGETPLQATASSGNVHAVRFLLESGADINLSSARGTALCYAASADNAEMVSYLLTKGAVVDLNSMRAAADKPKILGLLQWRNQESSGSNAQGVEKGMSYKSNSVAHLSAYGSSDIIIVALSEALVVFLKHLKSFWQTGLKFLPGIFR
jgi:ankyrin repeat protein